jgi:two-component system sensor histidine kinase/response regulator
MGTFHTNPEVLSIEEILLETLEVVKYTAQEKAIKITNNISDYNVFADEECVKTILRNLLNNSIKFTYRNGSIVLNSMELETHIQISIEDNGVGMDQEVVAKLFNITSKSSTVGTENEKGTGLGLILCKDLIEKNNGTIWAESEFGKGSKFSFTLPKK